MHATPWAIRTQRAGFDDPAVLLVERRRHHDPQALAHLGSPSPRPVLEVLGTPVHLGPVGAGQVAKACNQLIVASTILALGEAAVIAERSGIDVGVLFELLSGGYAGSRILSTRGRRFVEQDYSPSGAARYMIKDLAFAAAEAERTGTRTDLLDRVRASFSELVDRGFGDRDIAVTRAYVESLER